MKLTLQASKKVERKETTNLRKIGLAEVTFSDRRQIAEHLQDSKDKSYLRLPNGQIVRASEKQKGKHK